MSTTILQGDCIEQMKSLPDACISAIVCDPPYGLEFMGKDWDAPWKSGDVIANPADVGGFQDGEGGNPFSRSRIRYGRGKVERAHEGTDKSHPFRDGAPRIEYGIGGAASLAFQQWVTQWATEALRILKPGGHILAFGGTRTFHRLMAGIEDAGFEVRDCISWLYATGFPKSMNVSKAIDDAAGVTREVVGQKAVTKVTGGKGLDYASDGEYGKQGAGFIDVTAPATPEAQEWDGWGTALKPGWEPCVVARKPLIGTVVKNVLEHGTGAINIDATRIPMGSEYDPTRMQRQQSFEGSVDFGASGLVGQTIPTYNAEGRWPANVAFDQEAARVLDEQTGESKSSPFRSASSNGAQQDSQNVDFASMPYSGRGYEDTGGASRFFYVAKASKAERNAGCDLIPPKPMDEGRKEGDPGGDNPRNRGAASRKNSHPTVKPVSLMRWLIRMVTPPGGVVLDPFAGSGTTGVAAVHEGVDCILIEREDEYVDIIKARIAHAEGTPPEDIEFSQDVPAPIEPSQMRLV